MMERKIKFRAWDGNVMLDASYGDGDWISFDGVPYTESSIKYNTPNIEIVKAKNYVVMQFTGKILNGIEVYAGDIIEFDRKEWGGDDNIFVVEWDDDACAWSFGGGGGKGDDEWRKVIGNIYQHPNLLKS